MPFYQTYKILLFPYPQKKSRFGVEVERENWVIFGSQPWKLCALSNHTSVVKQRSAKSLVFVEYFFWVNRPKSWLFEATKLNFFAQKWQKTRFRGGLGALVGNLFCFKTNCWIFETMSPRKNARIPSHHLHEHQKRPLALAGRFSFEGLCRQAYVASKCPIKSFNICKWTTLINNHFGIL